MALVNDIADLLAVHNEVNAIGGQRQEGVVGVVQLKKRQHSSLLSGCLRRCFLGYKLTVILFVSGSAMTPIFFRSKSPILRVMANLPLTLGCPKLFQVMKPPLFFTLEQVRRGKNTGMSLCPLTNPHNVVLFCFPYRFFSSFLSGVWSTVSLRALPFRHSMARLSPTLPTTSSMPSLRSATVEVVPGFIRGTTET